MQISYKCSSMFLSKIFRRTVLIILLCIIASFDAYSQLSHLLIENDTILKPDTNNVVRTAYTDSIVYSYYFDKTHSMLRSKHVYSLDAKDRREVVLIQKYCFCGQKALEENFKNYNRRLKTLDKNFTISKSYIAKDGEELISLYTNFSDQAGHYTQVGAELGWFCSGNRHDSTWYFPTKIYYTYRGTENGERYRYRLNSTEQRGIGYAWYESGNVWQECYYKNGEDSAILFYYDTKERMVSSKSIYAKNQNAKGATYLSCSYYPDGTLRDSIITDWNTKDELEKYYYYKNGLKKWVFIHHPYFQVSDSYDSTGHPEQIERKALYRGKWYECKQMWFPNGQLWSSSQSQQFYVLHPEYGSLPDSLIHTSEEYLSNGTKIFYSYTLKNGLTYSYVYRQNGTLKKCVIFNSVGRVGTETEYDENGNSISIKNINLNKK